VTFCGKGISVECDEGVLGAGFFEGVVECEETREVFCVRDEGCPYYVVVSCDFCRGETLACPSSIPLLSFVRPS
jgi:hypothetical protein